MVNCFKTGVVERVSGKTLYNDLLRHRKGAAIVNRLRLNIFLLFHILSFYR